MDGCELYECWQNMSSSTTAFKEILFSQDKTFMITTGSYVRRNLRDYNYLKGRIIEFPYKNYEPLALGIPFHTEISPLKVKVSNMAHLKLKESGIFDKIKQHVNPRHPLGQLIVNTNFQPAAILQVKWAYLIYGFGAGAAVIICMLENIIELMLDLRLNDRVERLRKSHWTHCPTCTCSRH